MMVSSHLKPDRSRFTECFIRENGLDGQGFKTWVFTPGMLFGATNKWWGDLGKRDKPHEGLDLCLYKNGQNQTVRFDSKMKIPVMYDGVVAGILDDFLGRSLIVKHDPPGRSAVAFCTIYGHTRPKPGIDVGIHLKQGTVIASLADTETGKAGVFPHLHISMGWASRSISAEGLNWKTINHPDVMTLIDPLQFLNGDYLLLKENDDCLKRRPDRLK